MLLLNNTAWRSKKQRDTLNTDRERERERQREHTALTCTTSGTLSRGQFSLPENEQPKRNTNNVGEDVHHFS